MRRTAVRAAAARRRRTSQLVAGLVGAGLGLRVAGRTTGRVGPLDVSIEVDLARRGGVDVRVPPLGAAHLRTHRGPLRVAATATGLDPDAARALLEPAHRTAAAFLPPLRRLALRAGTRAGLAGLAGSAAFAAGTLRRPADVAAATAVGAAGLLAVAATAAGTRDTGAWRTPELTGLLTRAPLVLGDLRAAPDNLARYRDQLAELIATGTAVYDRVADLPAPPPADAIRLVHISDIHLSPLALPLARVVVERYGADAVLDTGDLVDWGTPAEQQFAAQLPSLGVPYVYVKGNHDSPGIAAAVARQPNAVVLDAPSGPREVAGLTFVGVADPRFTPDKTTGDDHAPHRVRDAGRTLADTLRRERTSADIALVHAPAAGRELRGLVPLVLAGDIHCRRVRRFGDTILLVQGTTGGSGLRGVQQDPPTPVSLSVLFIDRSTRRLWGVDELTLDGVGGRGLHVVRRSSAELLGEPVAR